MTETEIDKSTQCEVGGLFKDFDFHLVQSLDTSLIKTNYWLFNAILQEQYMILLPASFNLWQEKALYFMSFKQVNECDHIFFRKCLFECLKQRNRHKQTLFTPFLIWSNNYFLLESLLIKFICSCWCLCFKVVLRPKTTKKIILFFFGFQNYVN